MLKIAVKIIKEGGVVICPTDTVYGLLADATNKKAVEKVFQIKKRPKDKPLPIFVKDIKMAKNLTKLSNKQEEFLKKIWPGAVTAVLKRRKGLKLYGVAKNTIAIRIPKYGLLLSLAKQFNRPLTGTSANISGKPASGDIKEVLQQFKGKKHQPDLIVDAGILPGKPSKVIDLTTSPYKILRQ